MSLLLFSLSACISALLGAATELWISVTSASNAWRTVDFTFTQAGEFRLMWNAKRILKSGAYGIGDLAIDDIRLTECDAIDLVGTTVMPSAGQCVCTVWICRLQPLSVNSFF